MTKARLVLRWTPIAWAGSRGPESTEWARLSSQRWKVPKHGPIRACQHWGVCSSGPSAGALAQSPVPVLFLCPSLSLWLFPARQLPRSLQDSGQPPSPTASLHRAAAPSRRAAYATISLRGLFLSSALCRLGHGRREWPDGLHCRHLGLFSHMSMARWLVPCCFLVFLAPSLHQPRLCELPR